MKKSINSGKYLKFVFLLCALTFVPLSSAFAKKKQTTVNFSNRERQDLIALYVNKGFDRRFLEGIFLKKQLVKYPIVIHKNVNNKENRRNYEDFYSPYSMKMAKRFSRKWRTVLQKASDEFQVEREVLVAILLVETGLGNVMGRYPVISVFSSIIVEYHEKSLEWAGKTDLTGNQKYVLDRLTLKSEWAKEELAALLTIVINTKNNPFRYKGSFAGAFGIPQFLPSSYLKWGYDSDKNGTVNLFLVPDAVYSTANYLKAHGWKKGLYRESNKDVIYKYNNSNIYVDTVLGVAKKIRAYQPTRSRNIPKQAKFIQDSKGHQHKSTS